jgi:hypothetical protein
VLADVCGHPSELPLRCVPVAPRNRWFQGIFS